MKMEEREAFDEWYNELAPEDQRKALLACIEELMLMESVRFSPVRRVFFWEACGEAIVDG